jgi:murein DD-endopeptidase MepM/ murein hydrolase activator NlpD
MVWLWPLDNSGWINLEAPTPIPIDNGTTHPWTYVVATWDGMHNLLSIYINGKLDSYSLLPGVASSRQPGTSYNFTVGGFSPGEQPFPGGIDEVAYYNSALTADQILAHYRAASTLVIPTSGKVTQLFLTHNPSESWSGPYYDLNNILQNQQDPPSHPGVDIAGGTKGTSYQKVCSTSAPHLSRPVYAAGNGTVVFRNWDGGFGWTVVIAHHQFPVDRSLYPSYYLFSLYGHMGTFGPEPAPTGSSVSCISPALALGDQVVAGRTLLGWQGNSGEVKIGPGGTGTHLHWQLYVSTASDAWSPALDHASPDFETCMGLTVGDSTNPEFDKWIAAGSDAC